MESFIVRRIGLTFAQNLYMKLSQALLLLVAVIVTCQIQAQSATSVANGPWLSPFTWNCTCVPTPGYTVTIAHRVTLNTSFQLPSGSITVNAGAALVQDSARDMLMNGGAIINHGTVDFRYLLLQSGSVTNTDTLRLKSFANYATIQNSGVLHKVDSFYNVGTLYNSGVVQTKKFQNNDTVVNNGLFTGVDSFYNLGYLLNNNTIQTPTFFTNGRLINNGAITGVDSFTNAGILANNAASLLQADTMLNTGTFTNQGVLHNTAFANLGTLQNTGIFTFYDGYNFNVFSNSDSLRAAHSFLNTGRFVNSMGGKFYLGGSFLNIDSLHHDASCFNDGVIRVDSNWFNGDTVTGAFGSFTVAFETGNAGIMKGSFDFCDLTPPATAPYIDHNNGAIGAQITWCAPQAPDATFNALDVCQGAPVIFNNTSTGAISNFYWSFGDGLTSTQTNPVHTYAQAATYQVMLIAANGLIADTGYMAVTVHALPSTPVVTVHGDTLTCLSTADSYAWYFNGGWQGGLTTQSVVAAQAGFYSVKVTDAFGCTSAKSDSVEVILVSGMDELYHNEAARVFPNPFNGKINLQFAGRGARQANVWIYDLLGQTLFSSSKNLTEDNTAVITLNLEELPAGLYVYKLQVDDRTFCGMVRKE